MTDDLLTAQIDGLEFLCMTSSRTGGRRTVVTEIPDDEGPPRVEDMGRSARRYSISAVLIGPRYRADLDALTAILDRGGTHDLRHPWEGDLVVRLEGQYAVEESQLELSIARVSMSFVEAGTDTGLTFTASPGVGLTAAATTAFAAAEEQYATDLDLLIAAADAVLVAVGQVTQALAGVDQKVSATLNTPSKITTLLTDLQEELTGLVARPGELAAKLGALWSGVGDAVADADGEAAADYPGGGEAVQAEAAIGLVEDAEVSLVDEGDDDDGQAAAAATERLTQAQAAISAAKVFANLGVASTADAATAAATIGGALTALAVDPATSDKLSLALLVVRDQLQEKLAESADNAPDVETFTAPPGTPALLLAWQIYGDPGRDLEIVARNEVRDPNLLQSTPLSLLVPRV